MLEEERKNEKLEEERKKEELGKEEEHRKKEEDEKLEQERKEEGGDDEVVVGKEGKSLDKEGKEITVIATKVKLRMTSPFCALPIEKASEMGTCQKVCFGYKISKDCKG